MADPLSIAASVVGIIAPAFHGIRLLLEDLQQLKEAPKTVKRLLEHAQSVDASLKLLQACSLFRADLQRWTRHSEGGKLAWQDRTSVGFFKQGQIKAISEQLQNCKLSINSVVSIATLYSSLRHTHITEDIRRTMSLVQAEVKGAATTIDKQLVVLESKVEELNLSSDDEQETRPKEGKVEVLQQLEEERKALEASRTLLDELLSKAQEDAVAKAAAKSQDSSTTVATVTFGDQNSGQQAGVINSGVHGAVFGRR
ncbi:hypothetical protein BDW02DRAFT_591462 [Decorospora gaudefroyi]|uniref:Azaphilone pigments biosynthesis cluster protein L N-terminal domain-containing protein n=1 Tax=Decorospora gaudefroyi TaxID=184978 RepID=A0A6A5K0A2_9PLEO|nr:hypothetical protein BDW02DRAFT_591462 [Decorospora gaudefroyi]